jgi:long-chain acyl-CoA synthetase
MSTQPWLATYRENGIPADINPRAYPSVTHLLEEAMTRFADKPAFRSFGQTLSYADVDRLSGAFAAWLQNVAGVKKGDRVAVMSPNLLAFPLAMIGIVRAGGVQVNVNPLYTPRELAHQLKDAGCKIIVIFNGSTPVLAEAIAQTDIETVITVAPGDGSGAALPAPPVDARLTQTVSFADALKAGADMKRTPVECTLDDLLFLQYTGGTTGLSKGASLSHGNLVANTEQFKAIVSEHLRPGQEVIVTAIPLYHIFALMVNFISYFSVGADNWLVANPRDMDGFVDLLAKAKPSVFMGVNTLYAGLTMHPRIKDVDFSNLKLSGGGGSAIVEAVSSRWKALTGTFIREGYGLSETSPVVSFNPASTTSFNGTTGIPLPGTDVRLFDDEGKEVALGESGEVCVKGPQVMRGYWGQPDGQIGTFTESGYFRTGDVGVFDERGLLKIVDRKKDMILVSGFNVFPNEVEAVASGFEGVAECACIGVPDEKTGEAVQLFVVAAPGKTLDFDAMGAYLRSALTAYKVPKRITQIEALPKSTVGKILRRELRSVKV